MKKLEVLSYLRQIRDARAEAAKAQAKFRSDVDAVLNRLLHEGVRNYMSAEEMAAACDMNRKAIRQRMRDLGLNPRDGKNVLSKRASEALANNAALLGVEPSEMDLMSPLAYLPMGDKLKRELQDATTAQVTTLDDEVSGNRKFDADPVIDALQQVRDDAADYCNLTSNHGTDCT
jgi:hypothetical protein